MKLHFLSITIVVIGLCVLHDIKAHRLLGKLASGAHTILDNTLVNDPCKRDATPEFIRAIYVFVTNVYKRAALYSNDNFVISPISMWLSLSAIAEGAHTREQRQLFKVLNLPEKPCMREQFYKVALSIQTPGSDVMMRRQRALIVDEQVNINSRWEDFALRTGLLSVTSAPIKRDPASASAYVKKVMSMQSHKALHGHSLLVDSLDFEGLWTTAFPEARIERAPFYNDAGMQIGQVDLMRMKKHVRLAHLPLLNAKVLELPVGDNGRYTMLITMGLENQSVRKVMEIFHSSLIVEILQALIKSLIPLEIAVPKFTMTSEFDAKPILQDIGVESIWTEPAASMYISNPPPVPTGYLQRVTIKIGSAGVNPPPSSSSNNNVFSGMINMAKNSATGLASAVGHDFIANRPFMYTLIDTKTKSCVFAGAFSKPTYV